MRLVVPLALLLALALPGAASASPRQFSIMQDDGVFLGLSEQDPVAALAEAKALGADMVRTFVVWRRVAPAPTADAPPADVDMGDPNAPGYDWGTYDRFVDRARALGLKVFLTLSPGIPDWASEEPSVCPHFTGGYRDLPQACHWRPRPRMFFQFAKAAARRYSGRVDLWSLYNEPNLEHYLYPQLARVGRKSFLDLAAVRYRKLWWEGWKAIAQYDPGKRDSVLFGETAAISSPMDTLYAALCLDERGRPFRGRMKRLHGCQKPRRLPIAGIAHHPYNSFGRGSVFTKSHTLDSLPLAYVNRLGRLMRTAERRGRIPRNRGIYLTEFGFQTNPPDRKRGQSLGAHARSINEADRLFFADRRVAAVAQFELYDAPEPPRQDVYNTGLRLTDGRRKPAWGAYRMPLVVSRLGRGRVEVWGQVRPAEGAVTPRVQTERGGVWTTVATPRTNAAGYFRIRRRASARARWRLEWDAPGGGVVRSRIASAGRKIRYLK
jgi:hypothetical protein